MSYRDMVLRSFRDNERVLPHWNVNEIMEEPLLVYFVARGTEDDGPFDQLGLERTSGEIGFWEIYDDDSQARATSATHQGTSQPWPPVPFFIMITRDGEDYAVDVYASPTWK